MDSKLNILTQLYRNNKLSSLSYTWYSYSYIQTSQTPDKVLRLFLDNMWYEELNESDANIQESEYPEISDKILNSVGNENASKYQKLVDEKLHRLVEKNLDVDSFYSQLWQMIQSDADWDNEYQKALALFYCILSGFFPYFQISPPDKDSDEFLKQISKDMVDQIKYIRYLSSTPLLVQRTQTAKMVLDEILSIPDTLPDRKDRMAILLANSFSEIENKGVRNFLQTIGSDDNEDSKQS